MVEGERGGEGGREGRGREGGREAGRGRGWMDGWREGDVGRRHSIGPVRVTLIEGGAAWPLATAGGPD